MSPRALPATAMAAAAALSLLLTACGDDDGDASSDDKIQGADKAKDSPSPSPSEPETPGRPEIKLPDDLELIFDWPSTGDDTKDAVLQDAELRIRAVDLALVEQDPVHEAYRFFSGGEVAADTETYIQAYVDEKARTTGRTRFYDAQITMDEPGVADLIYCEDQTKSFDMYLEPEKVNRTEPSNDDYIVHQARLRENDAGVWVTEQNIASKGAEQCLP
ncbi:hypothetical protein [Streptomyces sp. MAR4 CNX-425]|uniref:hypothetical protein n=1 Tax=Streptomyces sp. MAR4 CNX-425 TaxID=3406343 RepID=UPI003B51268E